MIPIRLKKSEISSCEQFAALRWQLARMSSVANDRRDPSRTDNDIDLLGIKAELAVSKLFNLDFSPSSLGIDSGNDLYIDVGTKEISIQVKSSFYPNGRLLFKSLESFTSDIAILVTASEEQDLMIVKGWISKKDFISANYKKDLGHGEGHMVDQEALKDIPTLWKHIVTARHS